MDRNAIKDKLTDDEFAAEKARVLGGQTGI